MRVIMKFLICLSAALAVTGATANADTRTQKNFGQWQVNCNEGDNGAMKCALHLSLINKKNKAVVFGWTIAPDKDGQKALLQTPTGMLLADGIQIQFPGSEPVSIPYRICAPRYCFAEFDFVETWHANFTSQKEFSAMFKNAKGQELKYPVSLEKFGEAYDYYTLQLQGGKQ